VDSLADSSNAWHELDLRPLRASGQVYLDYTGAALYSEALLREHTEILTRQLFGNPHSAHQASLSSTLAAGVAREAVFHFLDADHHDYEVVWTANASSALRLVGDASPFGPASPFVLTADNHNSVNGIRQLARARGAPVLYLPLDDELRVRPFELPRVECGLFAYPAQSNFSGVRHPLDWIEAAQQRGYTVLLDAAAFVPTSPLSLREVRPDFVALSIYKISGYPTGIGALICRHDALRALVRPSFAGGTVEFVSVLSDRHQLKTGSEGFEDGTGNFLAWSGVPPALQMIERLGMPSIHAQVDALTAQVLDGMASVRHGNGSPAVWIHGPAEMRDRGGTIAFNLVDDAGRLIDHEQVVDAAAAAGICLRGGCFCNPGAAEQAFRYEAGELAAALDAVADHFSIAAMRVALNNKPVGAVRASFGYASTASDVQALVAFLEDFASRTAKP
jgi:selenocysteine lyase/cysteine desulfurase